MGILSGFSGLFNQKKQKPKAESKKTEDVERKLMSETYPEDMEETKKQLKLWKASEKKSPWHDRPPKVMKLEKVEIKQPKGKPIRETVLTMKFTIGLPPEAVFHMFTKYEDQTYFKMMKRPQVLKHKSTEVLRDDGPALKLVSYRKSAHWKFLFWFGTIPIQINTNENRKDFSALYVLDENKKLKFIKSLTGKWQVEPYYVDNDRYCKPKLPKNREEYKKCTHGKGLIASKVTVTQGLEPSLLYRLPPLYWLINRATVKTTKDIAEEFQIRAAVIRGT